MVRQLIDRPIDHMRAPMADRDRVAVGGRPRHPADADRASSARRILNDDDLPERCPHPLGHDARNRVGRAASRIGHDHRHRPRWIVLRARIRETAGRAAATAARCKNLRRGSFIAFYLPRNAGRLGYINHAVQRKGHDRAWRSASVRCETPSRSLSEGQQT